MKGEVQSIHLLQLLQIHAEIVTVSLYQCELLGANHTGEFLFTTRNEVTTISFNCVEEITISISCTTWYLFKAFIHTSELCSCFVKIISSHKIAVVLSIPSWRTFIMRRNHYLVSTSISLAECTRNIAVKALIQWRRCLCVIFCSIQLYIPLITRL